MIGETAYSYLVIYDSVSKARGGKVHKWLLGSVDHEGALPILNGVSISWGVSSAGLPTFEVNLEIPLDLGKRLLDSTIFAVGNIGVLHYGYSGGRDYMLQGILLPDGISLSIDQSGVSGSLSFKGQDFYALSRTILPLKGDNVKRLEDAVEYLLKKINSNKEGVMVKFSDKAKEKLQDKSLNLGLGKNRSVRQVLDWLLDSYGLGYVVTDSIGFDIGNISKGGGRGSRKVMNRGIKGVNSVTLIYVYDKNTESMSVNKLKDGQLLRKFVFMGEINYDLMIYPIFNLEVNYDAIYFTDVNQSKNVVASVYMDDYGEVVYLEKSQYEVLKERIDKLVNKLNLDKEQYKKLLKTVKEYNEYSEELKGVINRNGNNLGEEIEYLDFGAYYMIMVENKGVPESIKGRHAKGVGINKVNRGKRQDSVRREGEGKTKDEKEEEKVIDNHIKILNELYEDIKKLNDLEDKKKSSKPYLIKGYPIDSRGYNEGILKEYVRQGLDRFGLKVGIETVGLPALIPSEYILLDNVGLMVDGVYLVQGIEHSIEGGAWTSKLDCIRIGGHSLLELRKK